MEFSQKYPCCFNLNDVPFRSSVTWQWQVWYLWASFWKSSQLVVIVTEKFVSTVTNKSVIWLQAITLLCHKSDDKIWSCQLRPNIVGISWWHIFIIRLLRLSHMDLQRTYGVLAAQFWRCWQAKCHTLIWNGWVIVPQFSAAAVTNLYIQRNLKFKLWIQEERKKIRVATFPDW